MPEKCQNEPVSTGQLASLQILAQVERVEFAGKYGELTSISPKRATPMTRSALANLKSKSTQFAIAQDCKNSARHKTPR
jgi:hypothetical protein